MTFDQAEEAVKRGVACWARSYGVERGELRDLMTDLIVELRRAEDAAAARPSDPSTPKP